MNIRIDPKQALNNVNALIENADKLLEMSYKEGSRGKKQLDIEIVGFVRAVFIDDNEKLDDYYFNLNHAYVGIVGVEDSEEKQQKEYIEDLETMKNHLVAYKQELGLNIASKDYNSLDEEVNGSSQSSVTQLSFNGPIENMAMGDIHNYDINIYLKALESVIENSDDIPSEEKKNLIDKIRSVANDGYVKGISTGLIVEAIKLLSTGVKPF